MSHILTVEDINKAESFAEITARFALFAIVATGMLACIAVL